MSTAALVAEPSRAYGARSKPVAERDFALDDADRDEVDAELARGGVGSATPCAERRGGSSTLSRPARIAALVVTACALTACTFVVLSNAPGVKESDVTSRTIEEYGGYIDALRWDSRRGFEVPKQHRWHYNRNLIVKVNGAAELIARTIETYFPGRLARDQDPIEVLFTISDYPMTPCVDAAMRASDKCHVDKWAPIFAFGTTMRDKTVLPAIIGAPLMALNGVAMEVLQHMDGGVYESNYDKKWDRVEYRHEMFDLGALEAQGAHSSTYEWDHLIKKVVWRGTDYPFLGAMYKGYKKESCKSEDDCFLNDIASATDVKAKMQEMIDGDEITPRLRAVLLSILHPELVDARFFTGGSFNGQGVNDETMRTRLGRELDLDTHTRMENPELSKYKYQLDIGGWGGTTWTGVIHKLSMPGILFHHETSMTDSYFDELKPWVHYVPVNQGLTDLMEKIKWAETHEEEAKKISENASAWVNDFTTRRHNLKHHYDKLAVPLQKIIDPERKFMISFDQAFDFKHPLIVKGGPYKLLDPNDV